MPAVVIDGDMAKIAIPGAPPPSEDLELKMMELCAGQDIHVVLMAALGICEFSVDLACRQDSATAAARLADFGAMRLTYVADTLRARGEMPED